MSTPQLNPEGYKEGSVMTWASSMKKTRQTGSKGEISEMEIDEVGARGVEADKKGGVTGGNKRKKRKREHARVLLVHGLIDENVHFRHVARLLQELIRHRVRHELLLFPDERHAPRSFEDRKFMEESVVDFLTEGLCEQEFEGVDRKK